MVPSRILLILAEFELNWGSMQLYKEFEFIVEVGLGPKYLVRMHGWQ